MKMFFATALIAASFTTQAHAANPTSKDLPALLKKSLVLQNLKKSVASEYNVPNCGAYEVTSYSESEGSLKAQAVCTYKDAYGDETGVIIQVEGELWDSQKIYVQKMELVFAG